MPGDIESFEDIRQARRGPGAMPPHLVAAQRYVGRAEEALALLSGIGGEHERSAVCRITEAWLSLAELSLQPAR